MHIRYLIVILSAAQLFSALSFGQSANTSVLDSQKETIRQIYNLTENSYKVLPKKIKEESRKQKIEQITKSVERYYRLATALERQGKYEQAELCYKKILK